MNSHEFKGFVESLGFVKVKVKPTKDGFRLRYVKADCYCADIQYFVSLDSIIQSGFAEGLYKVSPCVECPGRLACNQRNRGESK